LVVAGTCVLFYTSSNLIHWQSAGSFGDGYGAKCGVWETPDLFQLPVDNASETIWVLVVSIGDCAPAGGSGVQYFVGDFDGSAFTSDNPKDLVLWADYGADFYAPQSWNDAPDDRRIWLGWMSNWHYARDIPTSTWRGAMSIPREVGMSNTPEGVRMVQRPVAELEQLRGKHHKWHRQIVRPGTDLLAEVSGGLLEISADFQVDEINAADRLGLRVRTANGERTTIGYEVKSRSLFVDRRESGETDFSDIFSGIHIAPLAHIDGKICLRLFVDRSSVEVFANDGLVNMTERIFPAADSIGVEVFADGGEAMLNSLDIYELSKATFMEASTDAPAAHAVTIVQMDDPDVHPGHISARKGEE